MKVFENLNNNFCIFEFLAFGNQQPKVHFETVLRAFWRHSSNPLTFETAQTFKGTEDGGSSGVFRRALTRFCRRGVPKTSN
jgi:hypothetical protein